MSSPIEPPVRFPTGAEMEAARESSRRFIAGWFGALANDQDPRTESVVPVGDYHEADRFIMALHSFGFEVTPNSLREWWMHHDCDGGGE